MPEGSVRFYDTERGVGSLVPDGGGPDIPLDADALNVSETLAGDQRVSFELVKDAAGELRALNVVPT